MQKRKFLIFFIKLVQKSPAFVDNPDFSGVASLF